MLTTSEIFLDIETDWHRNITVLGFRAADAGLVQLIDTEVTAKRVKAALPKSGKMFTFNGHCFDLAVIRTQLGIDLRAMFESIDLRWVCQRAGLSGGQKVVEQRFGVERQLPGLSGADAITLWRQYQRGDARALKTLLTYNAEDVDGIAHIRSHLCTHGLLTV